MDKLARYKFRPKHTDETKQKISQSKKGVGLSDEHKAKIADSRRGQEHSLETRKKISKNNVGFKGRRHTKESKAQISESCRLVWEKRKAGKL